MASKEISPIWPMPSWFLDDVLNGESKDVARLVAAMIRQSLEQEGDVFATFKNIADWTGLGPDRITESMKRAREKGYFTRIKKGELTTDGTRKKSIYRVNWNYAEPNVDKHVLSVYKHIEASFNVADAPDGEFAVEMTGKVSPFGTDHTDQVRIGRNGPTISSAKVKQVFSSGFNKTEEGPQKFVLDKIKAGNFSNLTSKDLLLFWQWIHLKRTGNPYVPTYGKDTAILARMQKTMKNEQILMSIRWIFESGQKQFKTPGIPLLGSRWINSILVEAKKFFLKGGS